MELAISRRLEAEVSKRRILEIYLNVIEWGDGIYGAGAAARAYFQKPASALGPDEAALLAACIINPRAMNPSRPSTRLVRRQRLILDRMMRSSTSAAGRSGRPGASSRVTDELVVHLDTPRRRS
jgi:monofunctional biosynthetic peptidoglycan transglycosylase